VDLGFRFFRDYWFRGYATEAARTALAAGFQRFGLDRIIGRTMRENLASTSVLNKLGMRFREVSEDRGLLWLIYVIEAESFHQPDQARPEGGAREMPQR
jgi:RimJ/RimL family protein N-acetyltransferase